MSIWPRNSVSVCCKHQKAQTLRSTFSQNTQTHCGYTQLHHYLYSSLCFVVLQLFFSLFSSWISEAVLLFAKWAHFNHTLNSLWTWNESFWGASLTKPKKWPECVFLCPYNQCSSVKLFQARLKLFSETRPLRASSCTSEPCIQDRWT